MEHKNYETVFILTPVLSDEQTKDAVQKFRTVLEEGGAKFLNEERWGLRKMAYGIKGKSSGFYALFEYSTAPEQIAKLETEFRRDERVLRFLTVSLDKHALVYNERRRKGEFNKPKKEEAAA